MPPTIERIKALVKAQEESAAWQAKAALMDEAVSIWSLEQYLSAEGVRALTGLKHYTSNDPRTFADMVVSMLAESKLSFRIPVTDQQAEERDVDSQKERFIIGIFKAADERLERLLLPHLQDALAWQAPLRGRVAVRALLAKDTEEHTYVDIMPWDSRYVFWGMGPKRTQWRCHKIWKLVGDIEAEYEISLDSEKDKVDEQGLEIYDWYDDEFNMVGTAEKILKKATRHGSPSVPVALAFVGASLPLVTDAGTLNLRGEDIFHSNRNTYKLENFLLSAHATRVAWQVNPNVIFVSESGEKNLPENILQGTGSSVALVKGEELNIVKLPEESRESARLEATVAMQRQKGSMTDVAFGQAPYPMAGVSIEKLRAPMSMVISPCQKAMVSIYQQISRLICDQYASGAFNPFEVSGRDKNRTYFRQTITPDIVQAGGEIEVKIAPNLPQDDPARWAMYAAARQPDASGVPGISQRTGLEMVGIEDVDLEMSAIISEMASRFSPLVMARRLMLASEKQGEMSEADIWLGEAMMEMRKRQMAMAQLGITPPGGNGKGSGLVNPQGQPLRSAQPLNKGFNPALLHGASVGNPPAYNPAEGPQVPPGTPRPGAQAGPFEEMP